MENLNQTPQNHKAHEKEKIWKKKTAEKKSRENAVIKQTNKQTL